MAGGWLEGGQSRPFSLSRGHGGSVGLSGEEKPPRGQGRVVVAFGKCSKCPCDDFSTTPWPLAASKRVGLGEQERETEKEEGEDTSWPFPSHHYVLVPILDSLPRFLTSPGVLQTAPSLSSHSSSSPEMGRSGGWAGLCPTCHSCSRSLTNSGL